jgi:outer membrane protein TolC
MKNTKNMYNYFWFLKKTLLLFALLQGTFLYTYSQKVLTLEEALGVAQKNSPDILKSELNMVISQENLNARKAATKSQFFLNVAPISYSQSQYFNTDLARWYTTESKSTGGDFVVTQPIVKTDGTLILQNSFNYFDVNTSAAGFDSHTFGFKNNLFLKYSQPLFTYNKQKMELEQLKRSLENATLSYSIQRMYLEQQVTKFFYSVYQIQMALKVAGDEYKNQQVSNEIIKSKVEGGLSAKEQLFQAELNLAQSESNLKNKQVELANAMDQFRQYLGMPLDEEFEIMANIEYKPVEIAFTKAIQNGLETRMELRQREINIESSNDNLTVAKSTNEFKANADLSFGYFGQDQRFQNIYDKPTRSPEVVLTLSIPIWDWGQRKSLIKAAEADIKIEEINLQDQRTNIELAIRQSFRSLQNLALQIEIAIQNEKNAQLTYDINLERYRNGDLTSMDLSLFQNQLSTAKMNLVNSQISYKLELLNMKIETLWDFETNSSFVPKEIKDNIESFKMK